MVESVASATPLSLFADLSASSSVTSSQLVPTADGAVSAAPHQLQPNVRSRNPLHAGSHWTEATEEKHKKQLERVGGGKAGMLPSHPDDYKAAHPHVTPQRSHHTAATGTGSSITNQPAGTWAKGHEEKPESPKEGRREKKKLDPELDPMIVELNWDKMDEVWTDMSVVGRCRISITTRAAASIRFGLAVWSLFSSSSLSRFLSLSLSLSVWLALCAEPTRGGMDPLTRPGSGRSRTCRWLSRAS